MHLDYLRTVANRIVGKLDTEVIFVENRRSDETNVCVPKTKSEWEVRQLTNCVVPPIADQSPLEVLCGLGLVQYRKNESDAILDR